MMTSTSDIRPVFVDTSAWISLMSKNEQHHVAAVEFHKSLNPIALRITSWGIVSETFTWIRYHVGSREAFRWLPLKEVGIRKVINRFHDQNLSYVDAFSITLMQSRPDIDAVFAFDHHMALAGLPVLPGPLK